VSGVCPARDRRVVRSLSARAAERIDDGEARESISRLPRWRRRRRTTTTTLVSRRAGARCEKRCGERAPAAYVEVLEDETGR
jgi:hypothetical protein